VSLRLGPGLELPADAITQTFGVLAVRGAGKSNLAAVMAEEMHRARLPFVVVDPVGSWWGLRSSADGTAPGLEIPIFGGRHGDVPLEENGGQVLADLVVDDRVSCVLDVSELSEGAKTRFLIDFGERLYRRNTEPLHLFLEEADDYAPQRPFREQARLLRVWENVVRRGRARGLGITLITQRSAALNKSVLTQVETLFVLRTTSPQDRKAIAGWIEYHGQSRQVLETLDKLAAGEAWVWSPQWLKTMKRVQVRRRATFDSGATPKNVRGARPAATLADVDLGKVRARMAATIERAKEQDPKALRAEIASLKRTIDVLNNQVGKTPPPKVERVEVPVLKPAELVTVQKLTEATAKLAGRAQALIDRIAQTAWPGPGDLRPRSTIPAADFSKPGALLKHLAPVARRTPASANGRDKLASGERRMLTAIAQHPEGVTREQLTQLTGYRRSTRDTYVQRLGQRGLLEILGAAIVATQAGVDALGDFEPLPVGDALRSYWLDRLPEGERKILETVARAYPKAVERERISEATGYARSSRDTYLQRLSARRLVESVGRGEVRARAELFS